MKPTHVFLVVPTGLLACLATSSATGADIEAGFTGISVDVRGAEGTDYVALDPEAPVITLDAPADEEACMMLQFPTSIPEPFWRTSRDDGSPRNVQLENFRTTLAMAIPSYDSYYFGTSGADRSNRGFATSVEARLGGNPQGAMFSAVRR